MWYAEGVHSTAGTSAQPFRVPAPEVGLTTFSHTIHAIAGILRFRTQERDAGRLSPRLSNAHSTRKPLSSHHALSHPGYIDGGVPDIDIAAGLPVK